MSIIDPNHAVFSKRCPKCGLGITPEGHDPCIANLPGVTNACCGHGQGQGYIQFSDGRAIRGDFVVEEAPRDKRGGVELNGIEIISDDEPEPSTPFHFWD
jgi:hypothetical protein